MLEAPLVMLDEDHQLIEKVLEQLVADAHARSAFVIDKTGPLIAEAGELRGLDTTGLASLTAGAIAATGGLAEIIGEREFPTHFHQGQKRHLQMTAVGPRSVLVVVFDDRSTLGLVRLRSRKAGGQLETIFEKVLEKTAQNPVRPSPLADLTDEDLDNLLLE